MRTIKKIVANFHIYLLWAVLSFFLWSWIFGFVNDTTTFRKVSIYIDCHTCEDLDLTLELEKDLPQGIKMMKIHSLDYVVFDQPTMMMGDILILRQADVEGYLESLCPITAVAGDFGRPTCEFEGEVYGILVYDGATGEGILSDYVSFLAPNEEPERFYMVFLKESRHLGSLNDSSRDDAALQIARRLLDMD